MSVSIGDQVRLARPQTFLKTADPMPMLRPPDLVTHGEIGRVTALLPADTAAVRFARGTFLLSFAQLMVVADDPAATDDPDGSTDAGIAPELDSASDAD